MYKIERTGTEFEIANYPWKKNDYTPRTTVKIGYDDNGFNVHFVCYESEILALKTEHNTLVCRDSCMELFMQFDPKNDDRYINIEINPNGVAYNSICHCREESELIPPEVIDTLNIKTKVFDDRWEIDYVIPVSYIKKYIPTYEHKKGSILRGNFYKCGDETKFMHYACFNNIVWDYPDFHRPEFFAEFELA